MATVRIPILGFGSVPDTSGDVFFQPLSLVAPTNDLYDLLVLSFNDSGAKDEINGSFTIPKDYAGTAASIIVLWTADSATTNSVVWDFDYNSIGAGESLDPSAHTDSDTVTDAMPGTTMLLQEASITLTAGDFAVDDVVLYQFGRDGLSGSDTLGATAIVPGLFFQYDT